MEHNVGGAKVLLEACAERDVPIVFSSSAAVYGDPDKQPIAEDTPCRPLNPYGESKLAIETLLQSYSVSRGLNSIALRYFNASGADERGRVGERHEPETHLIPLVLRAALSGKPVQIFGDDYPTPDGTCIRDYIHVQDVARAHALALEKLWAGQQGAAVFNLGTAGGASVMEIVKAARLVSGRAIPITVVNRRLGDPSRLVADPSRAERELGWRAIDSSIGRIVETAWSWAQT